MLEGLVAREPRCERGMPSWGLRVVTTSRVRVGRSEGFRFLRLVTRSFESKCRVEMLGGRSLLTFCGEVGAVHQCVLHLFAAFRTSVRLKESLGVQSISGNTYYDYYPLLVRPISLRASYRKQTFTMPVSLWGCGFNAFGQLNYAPSEPEEQRLDHEDLYTWSQILTAEDIEFVYGDFSTNLGTLHFAIISAFIFQVSLARIQIFDP